MGRYGDAEYSTGERKLINACKVMLLDHRHRFHLQFSDPMAFRQLIEAVMEYEPKIIDEVKAAEQNHRDISMAAMANCPACADPRNVTSDPDCPYHGHGQFR